MRRCYYSIDLGGTNIACAVADESMNLVHETSWPTESHLGPEGVINRIAALVESVRKSERAEPIGLGIGVPGLADVSLGRVLFLPNLPTQWRGIDMAGPLSTRLGCPVRLLNDARMATLGELRFGAGADGSAPTFAFFTVGTGIGGGLVIDGKLRLGPLGAAGELGHQTVLPDGPLCGCGNRGCLETLASGPAIIGQGCYLVRSGRAPILREQIEGDLNRLTPLAMVAAAEAGEESVRDVIEEAGRYLGIGVSNVITMIHPDLVVIGGGVAKMGEMLFEVVRATVCERVRMFPADTVRIEPSQLGDQAGVWGGLALAAEAAG